MYILSPLDEVRAAINDEPLRLAIETYMLAHCRSYVSVANWIPPPELIELRNFVDSYMRLCKGVQDIQALWARRNPELPMYDFLYEPEAYFNVLKDTYLSRSIRVMTSTFVDADLSDIVIAQSVQVFLSLPEDLSAMVFAFARGSPNSLMLGAQLETIEELCFEEKSTGCKIRLSLLRSRTGVLILKSIKNQLLPSMSVWTGLKKLIEISYSERNEIIVFGSDVYAIQTRSGEPKFFRFIKENEEFVSVVRPAHYLYDHCFVDVDKDSNTFAIKTPYKAFTLKFPGVLEGKNFTVSINTRGMFILVAGQRHDYEILFEVLDNADYLKLHEAVNEEIIQMVVVKSNRRSSQPLPGRLKLSYSIEDRIDVNHYNETRKMKIRAAAGHCLYTHVDGGSRHPKYKIAVPAEDGGLLLGTNYFLADLVPHDVAFLDDPAAEIEESDHSDFTESIHSDFSESDHFSDSDASNY